MNATNKIGARRVGRAPGSTCRRARPNRDLVLAQLKADLLQAFLEDTDNPLLRAGLQRAATEAESLAWLTPVPLLVLPALLEEKVRQARFYVSRQAELRDSTREWVSLSE